MPHHASLNSVQTRACPGTGPGTVLVPFILPSPFRTLCALPLIESYPLVAHSCGAKGITNDRMVGFMDWSPLSPGPQTVPRSVVQWLKRRARSSTERQPLEVLNQ